MSDGLAARLSQAQTELAQVRARSAELENHLAAPPAALAALLAHTTTRLATLDARKGELVLLERDVAALKLEVAQATAAGEELVRSP